MKKKRIFWKLFFFQKDSRNLLGKRKTFLKKQQPWKGRPWTVFIVTEFYYVVAAKLSFWYRRSVFNITSKEKKKSPWPKKKKYEIPHTPYFAICFDVKISRGPLCLILLYSLDPRALATQNPTANDPHFHHEWKFPWGAIIWDYEFDYYYI